MTPDLTVVTVKLEDRTDGGLRVYSDDLPGLILSGKNREEVGNKIARAIKMLFEQKGFKGVVVRQTKPISEVLQHASPRNLDVHVHHEPKVWEEQFIVELPQAA